MTLCGMAAQLGTQRRGPHHVEQRRYEPSFEIQFRNLDSIAETPVWATFKRYDMESEMREMYPQTRAFEPSNIELRMVRVERIDTIDTYLGPIGACTTQNLTDGMAGGRLKTEPEIVATDMYGNMTGGEGGTDLVTARDDMMMHPVAEPETLQDDADQGLALPVTDDDWGMS
jgi:hypothetical protein